jgi:hypothetical protein
MVIQGSKGSRLMSVMPLGKRNTNQVLRKYSKLARGTEYGNNTNEPESNEVVAFG